jgi:DsbC/DsbD-like thiol-disulfide interchange protein
LSQAVAYLLDWSAKDAEGKPIVIRDKSERDVEQALLALPAEAYKEITNAIDEHVKQMEVELTALKNARAGASVSPAI